jgi:hypothetical protein
MPVITDTILLAHIIVETLELSTSHLQLAMKMATPISLKFGRLANSIVYIRACSDFVLDSVRSQAAWDIPDMEILDAAQRLSIQISGALQMVDSSSANFLYQTEFSVT